MFSRVKIRSVVVFTLLLTAGLVFSGVALGIFSPQKVQAEEYQITPIDWQYHQTYYYRILKDETWLAGPVGHLRISYEGYTMYEGGSVKIKFSNSSSYITLYEDVDLHDTIGIIYRYSAGHGDVDLYFPLNTADNGTKIKVSHGTDSTAYVWDDWTISVTAEPKEPDLIVQNETVSPSTVKAGSSVSVSCTVKNQGDGEADSSEVQYYLSTNTSYGSSDIYLDYDYVSSLSVGETSSESKELTISSDTDPGTYYILFYADGDSEVSESNEGNNVEYQRITVTNPLPDLYVRNASINPTRAKPGESVQVTCDVKNQGEGEADPTHIRFYFSDDTRYDSGDEHLPGGRAVSRLSSGSSDYTSSYVTIPDDIQTGITWCILFYADAIDEASESDEDNNVTCVEVTVEDPTDTDRPSVQITSPTTNSTYSTEQSSLNIGGTASDNVGISRVEWSNNRGGSGSASGRESWSEYNITLYEGDNIITVTAYDAAGNSSSDTLTVARQNNNPTIQNVEVNPTLIQSGEGQNISWDSTNQSWYFFMLYDEAGSHPIDTSSFLSSDCQAAGANGSGGCLGQENPSSAKSDSWIIPSNLAPGRYRIKVVLWSSPDQSAGAFSAPFTIEEVPDECIRSADTFDKWEGWQDGAEKVNTTELRDGNASHHLSPAEIIYYSAAENDINPVLLLAKLQDEQSLLTQGKSYSNEAGDFEKRLEKATGLGIYKNSTLTWYGFYPQLVGSSYQWDIYRDDNKTFEDAYTTYTSGVGKYEEFTMSGGIYALVAQRMNYVAGTNYQVQPSSYGYYNDFKDISADDIQTLLDTYYSSGDLNNENLFREAPIPGSQVDYCGTPVPPTPEDPPTPVDDGNWIPPSDGFDLPVLGEYKGESKWIVKWDFLDKSYFQSSSYHPGEDWNLGNEDFDCGAPVYAVANGKVVKISSKDENGFKGIAVLVKHVHGENVYWSQYAHLKNVSVQENQWVRRGEQIAEIAEYPSDFSHLHFEMRDKDIYIVNWPKNKTPAEIEAIGYLNPTDAEHGSPHGTYSTLPGFIDGHRPDTVNVTDLMQNYINEGIIHYESESNGNIFNKNYIETRASFITILVRSLEQLADKTLSDEGSVSFNDVNTDDWFYQPVLKAWNLGILSMPADRNFRPGEEISRVEALAFTVRTYEKYFSEIVPQSEDAFADVQNGEYDTWIYETVQKGYTAGLAGGYDGRYFYPTHWSIRSEAVAFIDKLIQQLDGSNGDPQLTVNSIKVTYEDGNELAWYHLFKADEKIRIEAECEGDIDKIALLKLKISSNFTNPDGVLFALNRGPINGDKSNYSGTLTLTSDIVNTTKGDNDAKDELAIVEFDRDCEACPDNYSMYSERSFGIELMGEINQISKISLASANGSESLLIPPATSEYFKAGGFEKVFIEAVDVESSPFKPIFVRNQADWLIYTGHGYSKESTVGVRKEGDLLENDFINDRQLWFYPEDIGNSWEEDLEGVLLFACSVLNIDDYNNYFDGNPNPGAKWKLVTRKRTDGKIFGPKVLLGFMHVGPLIVEDNGGQLIKDWKRYWLDENDDPINSWHRATETFHHTAAVDFENESYWYWKWEKHDLLFDDFSWVEEKLDLNKEIYFDSGFIAQGDTISRSVSLNNFDTPIISRITWPGSDLDIVITTPSGHELDPTSDIVADYYEGETHEYYVINSDEEGVWNFDIAGIEVEPAGEPYEFNVMVGYNSEDGFIYVPGDYATIQAGIDAATDGEIVLIADGTYTGAGNKNLNFNGKAITVRSENGPENCIIDCQESGRGFYFGKGEGRDSILSGVTITNGKESNGGGIACFFASVSPTITNCIMVNNTATNRGGGIFSNGSSPEISDCIIQNNFATYSGGGIFLQHSPATLTVANCLITGNSANDGGGISCEQSPNIPAIINCTLSRNSAARYGGGIYCSSGAAPTLDNCILWNDTPNEIDVYGDTLIPVSYSDIQGGYEGEGNIEADPLFISSDTGDYHLQTISPCIDTGNPGSNHSNEPSPNANRINMGTYGNTSEAAIASNQPTPDSDGDGLPDTWEQQIVDADPNDDIESLEDVLPDDDYDGDGANNQTEHQNSTNPNNGDTDDDDMSDGWEIENNLNPLKDDATADPDGDKYTNFEEYQAGTNPNSADPYIMLGDVNGDGEITPGDALAAYELSKKFSWTAEEKAVADFNRDGEITPMDALLIYEKSKEF